MKFNQKELSGNGKRVANITLGKDELKLIWSICKEYRRTTPKIMYTHPLRNRLLNLQNHCAKILEEVWEEKPNKWKDKTMHSKSIHKNNSND